jgi:hypothetical protein
MKFHYLLYIFYFLFIKDREILFKFVTNVTEIRTENTDAITPLQLYLTEQIQPDLDFIQETFLSDPNVNCKEMLNKTNALGETPFHTLLKYADHQTNFISFLELFITYGYDRTIVDKRGNSLLSYYITKHIHCIDHETVRLFVEKIGIPVKHTNCLGQGALDLLIASCQHIPYNTFKLLLE